MIARFTYSTQPFRMRFNTMRKLRSNSLLVILSGVNIYIVVSTSIEYKENGVYYRWRPH